MSEDVDYNTSQVDGENERIARMALTQRFERYGTQHPRTTFAFGLTVGATAITGMVVATVLTVGLSMGGQDHFVSSGAFGGAAMGARSSDDQAYFAERTLVVTGAESNASAAADLASAFGAEAGPSEAMGMDPYGGFVEPGPGASTDPETVLPAAEGAATSSRISDEQAYLAELASLAELGSVASVSTDADTNAFAGAGLFVGDGIEVGAHEVIDGSSLSLRSSLSWVTPELRAGIEG